MHRSASNNSKGFSIDSLGLKEVLAVQYFIQWSVWAVLQSSPFGRTGEPEITKISATSREAERTGLWCYLQNLLFFKSLGFLLQLTLYQTQKVLYISSYIKLSPKSSWSVLYRVHHSRFTLEISFPAYMTRVKLASIWHCYCFPPLFCFWRKQKISAHILKGSKPIFVPVSFQ